MDPTRATTPRPAPAAAGEAGFTMIEVLIALTILLIGIAGLLSMQVSSMRATSFSRHATEAAMVAEDKMEELRTRPVASIVCATVAACTDTVDSAAVPDAEGPYTRVWTPSVVGDDTTIVLEVSWLEQGGQPYTITMTTVLN